MKKILIIFICSIILASCKSANDAFSLKKRSNTDEFLVEKKNPLVMPPDFEKLPSPKNIEGDNNLSEEDSIEKLIGTDKKKVSLKKEKKPKTSSIEKLILEKIN
jgi:hypothetical protein|tara:strand:+ start:326 stop:637 length:312 start_codon:yes stop_codon:yes gene_type:complete